MCKLVLLAMASQQPEVTVVAEGDHPLSPCTGQDIPDDSEQQRSEETSDMPQTVENGESIYKSTMVKAPYAMALLKGVFPLQLPSIAQFQFLITCKK